MCFGHRLPESPQQACVVGRPPSLRRPWTSFSHQEQGNQPRSLELHRKDPASHGEDTPTGQNGKNRSANENNNLTDVSTANTFLPRHFNYMLFLNVSQSCRKIGRYLDRGNAHRAKDKLELSFLSPHRELPAPQTSCYPGNTSLPSGGRSLNRLIPPGPPIPYFSTGTMHMDNE